jgi:hypothetical protein
VTLQIVTKLKYANAVNGWISRATAAKALALCRRGRSAINFMHLTQVSDIEVYAYNPNVNQWNPVAGGPPASCTANRVH